MLDEARLDSADSEDQVRALDWMNEGLQELYGDFDFHEMMTRFSFTIDETAQANDDWPKIIVLAPMDVMEIKQAELRDGNVSPAIITPLEVVSHLGFNRRTQGTIRSNTSQRAQPSIIAVRRIEGVREDVANDALISVQIVSSTADTATAALLSYGSIDRRSQVKTSAALNGATPVNYAGTHIPIAFSKSANTTGIVSLRQQTTLTVLAQIMPWDRTAYYNVFELSNFADQTYTVWMEYKRRPPLMSAVDDVPYYIPPEGHAFIVEFAKFKALKFQEDTDFQGAFNEAFRIKQRMLRKIAVESYEDSRVILERTSRFPDRFVRSIFRPR